MTEPGSLIHTPVGLAMVVFGGIVFLMICARLVFFGMFLLAMPITAAAFRLNSTMRRFIMMNLTDRAPESMEINTTMVHPVNAREEADAASIVEGFYIPRNLSYHPKHIWMKQEPHGIWRIGFDDFAQRLLGDIRGIDFLTFRIQKLGENGWQTSQSFLRGWDVHCSGKTVRINSPVQGSIVDINSRLGSKPSVIGENPYGEGWLCTIVHGEAQYEAMPEMQISTWMKEEVNRLRGYFMHQGAPTIQDGGELVRNPAKFLTHNEWKGLVREFISA